MTKDIDTNSNFQLVTFFSQKWLVKLLVLEIALNFPVPLPGDETTFDFEQLSMEVTYSLDDMIISLKILKIYNIVRLSAQYSEWTDDMSSRIW